MTSVLALFFLLHAATDTTSITTSPTTSPAEAFPAFPVNSASADWVGQVMDELPLRSKVAQMVMPWIPGGKPDRNNAEWRRARRLVQEEEVGGLIIGRGSASPTARWLNELQEMAALPLLIAADLEWGAGTRFPEATLIPINMALSAAGGANIAREAGRITAVEARAAGVHVLFAPVADVNINANNPVINTRSYGADPVEVGSRVVAFLEGARAGGAMGVVKHFPGHGDTSLDSHLVMPLLDLDRHRLHSVELAPFRAALAAGVGGVMTAHLAVPALEPPGTAVRPATFSPVITTNLLRGELGFDGLIVTDALNMEGARAEEGARHAAVQAVLAGADILLMPSDAAQAIDAVTAAVETGQISEDRIDDSLRRILMAKLQLGLALERTVDADRLDLTLGAPAHVMWAQDVAERSITVARAPEGLLPLTLRDRVVVSIEYADARTRVSGDELGRSLEEQGADVRQVRLWRRSTEAEIEEAKRVARQADIVLFASFARALPWRGTLGIPEPVAELADGLAQEGAVVVTFGDPYLIRQIPSARTYILAWSEFEAAQQALVQALVGGISVGGRLPVPLPPHHAAGDGIMLRPRADQHPSP